MSLLNKSDLLLRSQRVWLVPVALTVLGFGSDATRVSAQTTYPFQATYDLRSEFEPITPDVFKVTVTGESADAPYGLTKFTSMNYTPSPDTGAETTGPDAAAFGLDGLPSLTDIFFGSGNDRLYGISSTTVVVPDLTSPTVTGSATETITGGSGRFSGATGTLSLSNTYKFNLDPTAPLIGKSVVNGTIKTPQSVPEPENNTTLIGIGVLGVGFLLRRRSLEVAE